MRPRLRHVAGADLLGNGANGYLFSDWEFDMTIDFDKPLQTKSGEPVEIITTNGRGYYSVKGYIGNSEHFASWGKKGDVLGGIGACVYNLVNVPEKRYAYVNVYKEYAALNATREEADANCDDNRIYCMKIEMVEGQFDE
jgi:hypothetical protein